MPTRLPSLHGSIATFAHGGAAALATPNSREAFDLAAQVGIDGFDCTVRVTADGVAVVSDSGSTGSRLRRKAISSVRAADLPPDIVPLDELFQRYPDRTLSLDLPDDHAFAAVNALVAGVDPDVQRRLWLCSDRIERLMSWRENTAARLVSVIRLSGLERSPEQWMALLAQRSIDAVRLDHQEWHAGLVTLAHRFERYALARGPVHEREMATAIDVGIDGVSTRHPDRLAAVAALYYPDRQPGDGEA